MLQRSGQDTGNPSSSSVPPQSQFNCAVNTMIQYHSNHGTFGHIQKAETRSVYINTVLLVKPGGGHTVLRKILRD
jgi:hypothetical protein